jgi:nucleoside-diphosphate-sugar epimerase
MRVLVTGGAGFIGSHIAEALCCQGAKVVILDDLSQGNRANLNWRPKGGGPEFIEGDISDESVLRQAVPGCDWIFHEAAIASVPASVKDPLRSHVVNLDATLKLLLMAHETKIKRFMFASSSAIYGDTAKLLKSEEDMPCPLSPYALQKYGSEKYVQLFHQLYRLETVSLRYFNVFGPRQSFDSPYSGVIAKFCASMLSGKPPTIYGDGQQARDFIFIKDVVDANLRVAAAPAEKVAGKVFNVGRGQAVNLLQLVEALNHITGQELKPLFEPARAGDVRFSRADTTAIRNAIAFESETTWEQGLRQTLAFYTK